MLETKALLDWDGILNLEDRHKKARVLLTKLLFRTVKSCFRVVFLGCALLVVVEAGFKKLAMLRYTVQCCICCLIKFG